MSDGKDVTTDPRLVAATRVLAELLLVELDEERLRALHEDELASALRALGLEPPSLDEREALASEFFSLLLHPSEGAPPVQSLWFSAGYEGDSARAMRVLADEAKFEADAEVSRNAAPDHASMILLLWAETALEQPELAEHIRAQHLDWIPRALAHAAAQTGFYGALARCVQELVAEILQIEV